MKNILTLLICGFAFTNVCAQDYFEDAQGNGLPLINDTNNGNLNARATSKDNSLKLNLFKFFPGNNQLTDFVGDGDDLPAVGPGVTPPTSTQSWGAGLGLKGKVEQNLGSIFSNGVFSSGVTMGLYGAHRKIDDITTSPKIRTWLVSLQYSASSLRLYDANRTFDKMKIDTLYEGLSLSVAWFKAVTINNGDDNLIFGASAEIATKNNYATLQTLEVKDFMTTVTDPSTGQMRTVQIADDKGYGYSVNGYAENVHFTMRAHVNYIPEFLNHQAGVIFYPSVVVVENEEPRTNFELAFHLLEKGNPTLSKFALYFTLTDVDNSRAIENKTFIQRSFSVGIGAAFNMFTGKQ